MAKKTLQHLLQTSDKCIVAPCVYDCASARAVEMVGFEAMMLSGGEVSIAMNGVIDYGFSNLTDVEWITSRIAQTSAIPLAADIEDGFGGPLAVYRSARRMAMAGATALQLEDASDMEESTGLLSREKYLEKVKAALAALEGTNCFLIARTNADPETQMDEGCERMRLAHELGAAMTTVVKIGTLDHAKYVAERVPGWKMFPDVRDIDGKPAVTVDQIYPLGFNFMTMHYTLKAAMDGMLEHGKHNFAQQGCHYTCQKVDATGVMGMSATPLFDPQSYMELEGRFSGQDKTYTIVGNQVEDFPAGFVRSSIDDRL
ncbi:MULTISPECIES: isocitrate lyase/PEP mutase family protein [Sphingomonas]|uniref:Isocitrate lyase/PEP mutase family protein n=1 Tax=Sphingomonas lycopersici TaxID=2951807 RepID=A0AA42CP45_9SPHN|nr:MULTISPECIES: isocitrate lyase/PEP mutase family protein [Sphingomonas]MCW6531939.1 isocitrate lyase/PEP mutase family protein [Sphingomonas lycopersici]MCW6533959.1 isocitrate lyase/PEP mutase family protein [Sphingomonas lycopersici]OJU15009.1 MAG: carboxyphosphonoenolpyruvate phosphonomutase [Sphingomonas sp. 66-10]